MLLKGKKIFLTGGSRGLGRAACIELVKQGADVAFTYVSSESRATEVLKELKAINPETTSCYFKLDVKNSAEVNQVAAAAIKAFGKIDIVVNNAGMLKDGLIYSMSDEDWKLVLDTHLSGTFYVCRAFLDEFIFNKGGKFINISSIAYVGSSGQANYSAAKAGIIGFSKSLAKEYGNKDIYCNVIVPGYFRTELTDANASSVVLDNFVRLSMLQREGKDSEFGKAVVFFASELSDFVNGDVMHVTGGLDTIPPTNLKRRK